MGQCGKLASVYDFYIGICDWWPHRLPLQQLLFALPVGQRADDGVLWLRGGSDLTSAGG